MVNNSHVWMPDRAFKRLWRDRATLDEIAQANAKITNTEPPSRAAVAGRAKTLGLPSRRVSHVALVPRNLPPAHHRNWFRYALGAESRARQLEARGLSRELLSPEDRGLTGALRRLLYDGDTLARVIVYERGSVDGFSLVDAEPGDTEIIRPWP